MPTHYPVIPAKAGIQLQPTIDAFCASLDTGFRRYDDVKVCLISIDNETQGIQAYKPKKIGS